MKKFAFLFVILLAALLSPALAQILPEAWQAPGQELMADLDLLADRHEPRLDPNRVDRPDDPVPIGPRYGEKVQTADFAERCAAEGVFFCQGFDSPDDVPLGARKPEGLSISRSAARNGGLRPVIFDGVVRHMYPNRSGQSQSGFYFFDWVEAGVHEPIGPGGSLYTQWRQFMPAEYLQTVFRHVNGGRTKPKAVIISESGGESCTPTHVVVTSNNLFPLGATGPEVTRTPFLYNRCRPTQTMVFAGDNQPICDPGPGSRNPGACAARRLPEDDARWNFPKDVWVTYQLGLDVDPEDAAYTEDPSGRLVWNTHVRLWATVDGGPTVLVVDYIHPTSAFYTYNDDGTVKAYRPWGRVWLIDFMTKKDATQEHAPTYTDYDELIVGTRRIPHPQ